MFTLTLDTVARVGPTHQINYTGFTVITFDGDLAAPPSPASVCGPGWDDLLARLSTMRSASGASELYVALLPTGVPFAPVGVRGCGSTGVASGSEGDGFLLMHEVGHALVRLHAPCPANVVNPDPSYPTFTNPTTNRPPYPAGTIGEYGFNLATNSVPAPQDTSDVMEGGGCSPRWISPYTYVGMRNALVATQPFSLVAPSSRADDLKAETLDATNPVETNEQRGEHLHLIVRLREGGDVDFLSAFHVLEPPPPEELGPVSSVTCELLAADGEVLESARLYEELLQRRGGVYTQYFGSLPWEPSAAAIAVTRDGETLHTRHLEGSAPPVRLNPSEPLDEEGRQLRFTWAADFSDDVPVTYIPRYSYDDGETWRAVGPEQVETFCDLDLRALPGGEHCRFQVLASSNVRTSVVVSDPFRVQVKPTTAQILSPANNAQLVENEPVILHGRAFSPSFGTTPPEEMLWFSDLDGLVGAGHETVTTRLSTGRHQLMLRVPDGLGGESVAEVAIHVTEHVRGD
jgi:hypothetical protein